MKKVITNNKIMTLAAVILFVYGIVHSILAKDFVWFQRTGSLIVCIGIMLLARPALTNQGLLVPVKMADSPYNSNDPEHYNYIGETIPEAVIQDVKNRTAVNNLGPWITFIGTFIWGYGDILNSIFI
jgi:hypothetical protein